jgi:hypothetical protein
MAGDAGGAASHARAVPPDEQVSLDDEVPAEAGAAPEDAMPAEAVPAEGEAAPEAEAAPEGEAAPEASEDEVPVEEDLPLEQEQPLEDEATRTIPPSLQVSSDAILLDDADLMEERLATPAKPPKVKPRPPAAPPVAKAASVALSIAVPTVLDRLIEARQASFEARAEELSHQIDATSDKARTAALAYELGELAERHLEDEARAVKAFGRALQADPSLRSNLWAIRRIFYRRELWPNIVRLIGAEIRFATAEAERADLIVEKAHLLETKLGDADGARSIPDASRRCWDSNDLRSRATTSARSPGSGASLPTRLKTRTASSPTSSTLHTSTVGVRKDSTARAP